MNASKHTRMLVWDIVGSFLKKNFLKEGHVVVSIGKSSLNDYSIDLENASIDLNNFSGEYGLMIGDRKEWGKGIAKEASERIIDYCFNSLNLKKLNLGVKKNNLNEVAKNLYSCLREIKKKGYKSIIVEKIPNKGLGKTINDRLKRASKF